MGLEETAVCFDNVAHNLEHKIDGNDQARNSADDNPGHNTGDSGAI